jgi:flagellar export protein FliJ
MSKPTDKTGDGSQLHTLERWRTAELDSARAQHVELTRVMSEQESVRDRTQGELADTQSFVRERLESAEPLSPESLRQFAEFAAIQRQQLAVAQAAVEESRARCEAARAEVVERFEQLSVVQRLSQRRDQEAGRELQRSEQKRLDEQALTRLAGDLECNVKSRTEG